MAFEEGPMKICFQIVLFILLTFVGLAAAQSRISVAVVRSEFIFESAPFLSAHASTIVQTKRGLVAAWFGGTHEGADDVGIWSSRFEKGKWTAPFEIANGIQADGKRFASWNPVLFELTADSLILFFKVGIGPQRWWGMTQTSIDGGRMWSAATRLPDGILGPIKNKPVRLADGTLLSPSSTESTEDPSKWRVQFQLSKDNGKTWSIIEPPAGENGRFTDAIQPSILQYPGGRLQAVGRTRAGYVFQTWSNDDGRSWSPLGALTLPNPNAGTDAVTLRDGRQLIVYNHTTQGRSPLNVAVSRNGRDWEAALVLENDPGEYSYPAVIQTRDRLVHVAYTWNRKLIKHIVIDPTTLRSIPIKDGTWPSGVAAVKSGE